MLMEDTKKPYLQFWGMKFNPFLCLTLTLILIPISIWLSTVSKRHSLFAVGYCFDTLKVISYIVVWVSFLDGLTILCKGRSWVISVLGGLIAFPVFLFCFLLFTMGCNLNIPRMGSPKDPAQFMKSKPRVEAISLFSDELIKKQNIFWISNWRAEGNYMEFGVDSPTGHYVFNTRLMPKVIDFGKPLPAAIPEKITPWPASNFVSSSRGQTKVMLEKSDYEFCLRAVKFLRKTGFDSVSYNASLGVVKWQINDTIGWDYAEYSMYIYSPSGNIPKELKNVKRLNERWYFKGVSEGVGGSRDL